MLKEMNDLKSFLFFLNKCTVFSFYMLAMLLFLFFFRVVNPSESVSCKTALFIGKFLSRETIRCRVLKVDIGMSFLANPKTCKIVLGFQLHFWSISSLILFAFFWQRHFQVGSVIAELKERFQSHSMKSYRSRFQR